MSAMNDEILESRTINSLFADMQELDRDMNGNYVLTPTAKKVDETSEKLTTSIDSLQERLAAIKKEKAAMDKAKKTEAYKEDKKRAKKEKKNKSKPDKNLIRAMFNNADELNMMEALMLDEELEDEEGENNTGLKVTDKTPRKKTTPKTTLDRTYGKRFAPVVKMYQDVIVEFDGIAKDVQEDLDAIGRAKTMYKSSQQSNLISAISHKMSAVDKISGIAKTITDLEYKKEKDAAALAAKKKDDKGDENINMATFSANFLRGMYDDDDDYGSKSKKKKKDKKSKSKKIDNDDDDDDDTVKALKKQYKSEENDIANVLADRILKSGDIKFSAHERHIDMEGKYEIAVGVYDILKTKDWKFIAVSKPEGKIISNFKELYPGLLPKAGKSKMSFDVVKMKCTDKNSGKSYKIYVTKN